MFLSIYIYIYILVSIEGPANVTEGSATTDYTGKYLLNSKTSDLIVFFKYIAVDG